MGTLQEDLFTHMTVPRSVFHRMRNVPCKNCRENQNTHLMFNSFFNGNHAVCEVIWKNMVQPDRPMIII